MKEISFDFIVEKVKGLCKEANYVLSEDMIKALESAIKEEDSILGKKVLSRLLENARIAKKESIPICQDTGFAVFFVELGDKVKIKGGTLIDAINEGVRRGYREGYLRNSICERFSRKNTGDNTPAIVHIELVPGEKLRIVFTAKGGGSENMSKALVLKPSDGKEGVKKFVVNQVREAGANPCPPTIVGVGIGGTIEKAAILAKKALLRKIGKPHPDKEIAQLEREILQEINSLGIGPGGFGGKITSLAVHIETFPCHIASLPVAVNLNCHASRHREIIL